MLQNLAKQTKNFLSRRHKRAKLCVNFVKQIGTEYSKVVNDTPKIWKNKKNSVKLKTLQISENLSNYNYYISCNVVF